MTIRTAAMLPSTPRAPAPSKSALFASTGELTMPTMPKFEDYPFQITPLSEEDGGGWLVVFPDFPGAVMSDGETPEEALANGRDALEGVIAVYEEDGRELPVPGSGITLPRVVRRP
jgi:antitoxin HicB